MVTENDYKNLLMEIDRIISDKYISAIINQNTIFLYFYRKDIYNNVVSYLINSCEYYSCIDTIVSKKHPIINLGLILKSLNKTFRIILTCSLEDFSVEDLKNINRNTSDIIANKINLNYQNVNLSLSVQDEIVCDYILKLNEQEQEKNITTNNATICLLTNGDVVLKSDVLPYEKQVLAMAPTMSWCFLWEQLFEQLFDVKKCTYIDPNKVFTAFKVIICELERIGEHMLSMTNSLKYFDSCGGHDEETDLHTRGITKLYNELYLKLFSSSFHCNCAEKNMKYANREYAHSMIFSISRSKINSKITDTLLSEILSYTARFEKFYYKFERKFFSSHLLYKLRQKIYSTDLIEKSQLSGPLLRALSVNYDLRKAFPYLLYDQIDFNVSLGVEMSLKDLFIVKHEEIKESLKIINLIIKNFPCSNENKKVDLNLELEKQLQKFQNKIVYEAMESSEGEIGISAMIKSDSMNSFKCERNNSSNRDKNSTSKDRGSDLFKVEIEFKIRSALENNLIAQKKIFLGKDIDFFCDNIQLINGFYRP